MSYFFFFNDTATTEIYTLSLHDALPISFCQASPLRSRTSTRAIPAPLSPMRAVCIERRCCRWAPTECLRSCKVSARRSEEHTSELQSRQYLVCRLLLEKKKTYLLLFSPF